MALYLNEPYVFFLFFQAPYDIFNTHVLLPYISLHYHPGVGQTHVAFGAEKLQAFLQIPLCMLINLRKQKNKPKNSIIQQTSLRHMSEFSLKMMGDVSASDKQLGSIFFGWE